MPAADQCIHHLKYYLFVDGVGCGSFEMESWAGALGLPSRGSEEFGPETEVAQENFANST